ncbi:MAG: ABC transporter ATP-binding protein/permease [Pseudobutyrivibrio sp.]|nr:ABC transporter ATP-binding protein/permease [Pseudobutyrivibrio sp.]
MVEAYSFIKSVFILYKKYIVKILVCLFLSIAVGVTNIVSPIVMLRIFEAGIEKNSIKRTLIYSGLFVLVALVNVIVDYIYGKQSATIERNMATDLRVKIIKKIEKFEGSFFSEIDNGELYTLLYSDVEKVPTVITGHFLNLVKNILTLCGLGIFMSSLNMKLLMVLLVFQVFIIITQAKYTKKLERFNDEFRDEVIRKNNLAQEMVNNFLQIIAANIIKNTYRRIKKSEENFNNKWIKLTSETKLSYSIVYALNTAMIAAILSIGGILVIRENISMGALITFNIFSQRFSTPIVQIYRFPTDIIDSKISWEKLQKKINDMETMRDYKTDYNLEGNIELKNVNYSYGRKKILSNCSLRIKPRKSYAIVGKSGVGKSTLVKLIYRILEVNEGSIVIDGYNVNQIGIDNIRSQIAYISQEVFIANGTLRENLCVSENIKDKDIIRILEKVCLGDWYYKLERGLDTNLGDNGVKISGGERQRIAMARALLRNSSIILLDEATSMLDEKTESQIIDLISKLFDGKTLIMITHKKSIAKKMDNVIEIKNGSIEFIDKYAI